MRARARIDALQLADRVALEAPFSDPDAALAATDICLCLGWGPAGETTPLWLRCLAAGKPDHRAGSPRTSRRAAGRPPYVTHSAKRRQRGRSGRVDVLEEGRP